MKKLMNVLAVTFCVFAIFGCASTNVAVSPAEIDYTEIDAKTYFAAKTTDLYPSAAKGYKVSDVYILGGDKKVENGTTERFLILSDSTSSYNSKSVYATDYIKSTLQNDPTWAERINAVKDDKKYNGHYTAYLYCKKEGNAWAGYTTKVILYNIEGVPTQEQIDADKAAAEAERIAKIAKEEADKKAKAEAEAEARAAADAKGKALAKGYVYHGIDEAGKSSKLFANEALEEGHAYYISGFVVKYSGNMAAIEYGDGLFFSSQSTPIYVDYISQKVKAEVVEAGVTNLLGQTIANPLKVVVTGGKGMVKTPVVLGLISDSD